MPPSSRYQHCRPPTPATSPAAKIARIQLFRMDPAPSCDHRATIHERMAVRRADR